MESFDEINELPFPLLPIELNVRLFEIYFSDRLNLLRCVSTTFKSFIDLGIKTPIFIPRATDKTIYLESISLNQFAKENKIIVNSDVKVTAINKGMFVPYELLYPFTKDVVISMIRYNGDEYEQMLKQLLDQWPFVRYDEITISFLIEASDTIFKHFHNSSVMKNIDTLQLQRLFKHAKKRKYLFSFPKIARFQNHYSFIKFDHIKFTFPSNFKYLDFIDYKIPFNFLKNIDFGSFKHDEPVLIDIFDKRSIHDLKGYMDQLMIEPNKYYYVLSISLGKTVSRLCLRYQWFEPFLDPLTESYFNIFSLHQGCKFPSQYYPSFKKIYKKFNTFELIALSDDEFFDFVIECDQKEIIGFLNFTDFVQMSFLTGIHHLLTPNRRDKIVQTIFAKMQHIKTLLLSTGFVNLINNTWRKITIFLGCLNNQCSFWVRFFISLDDFYIPEEKEQELQIFQEFVNIFKASGAKLKLRLADLARLKHTELLKIFKQGLTFDKENTPLDVLKITDVIDDNVLDFLIQSVDDVNQITIDHQYIDKIQSPRVLIRAWNNKFLKHQDKMGSLLCRCLKLILLWDRIDLISVILEEEDAKSWLVSFGFSLRPLLLISDGSISSHQIVDLFKRIDNDQSPFSLLQE